MNWVTALFEYLWKFWPFAKVTAWERGIRVRHYPRLPVFRMEHFPHNIAIARRWPVIRWTDARAVVQELGPGIHLKIVWVDDVHTESIVPQNFELPIQSITTKDDRSITFGVNVTLEITDVTLNFTAVESFKESMYGISRGHLAKRCRALTWPELIEQQTDLEKSLEGTLTTRLKKWGATVSDVSFTDMAHTRAIRFYGEGMLSSVQHAAPTTK